MIDPANIISVRTAGGGDCGGVWADSQIDDIADLQFLEVEGRLRGEILAGTAAAHIAETGFDGSGKNGLCRVCRNIVRVLNRMQINA